MKIRHVFRLPNLVTEYVGKVGYYDNKYTGRHYYVDVVLDELNDAYIEKVTGFSFIGGYIKDNDLFGDGDGDPVFVIINHGKGHLYAVMVCTDDDEYVESYAYTDKRDNGYYMANSLEDLNGMFVREEW